MQKNHDIVAITETWLTQSNETPLLDLLSPHFEIFRRDRIDKKGGGSALFIRRTLMPNHVFSESVPDAYELLCCDIITQCKTCSNCACISLPVLPY